MDKIADTNEQVTTVRPFDCGTQFGDWQVANCSRCVLDAGHEEEPPTCPILLALFMAMFEDGTVSAEIADRMGYTAHKGEYNWMCNEWNPTEEWKAEWEKLHNE